MKNKAYVFSRYVVISNWKITRSPQKWDRVVHPNFSKMWDFFQFIFLIKTKVLKKISTDAMFNIKNSVNSLFWSQKLFRKFCKHADDLQDVPCEKQEPLHLTLLIDTSGKQVNRLGDKKKVLISFITKLFAKFENKDLLKMSIVLFGDYRSGQVSNLISPAEYLTEKVLQQKLKDFKW